MLVIMNGAIITNIAIIMNIVIIINITIIVNVVVFTNIAIIVNIAIITNIDSELTSNPPFLKINSFDASELNRVLNQYKSSPNLYREKAIKTAEQYYNLDIYMKKIVDKIYESIE